FEPPAPLRFELLPALQAALRFIEQSSGEAASVILGPRWRGRLRGGGQLPGPGNATQRVGQVGGTLGQFALGQAIAGAALQGLGAIPGIHQVVSGLPAPLQTYLARQAAQGALTGAATTGVQWLADPGNVGLSQLAHNVAFLGGGSLGSGLA